MCCSLSRETSAVRVIRKRCRGVRPIKLATLTGLALLLTAGYAFAAEPSRPSTAGAPPTASPSTSSGPTTILDDATCDATCQDIWAKVVGGGNSLSYQNAGPYIKNLKLADPDNDNEISKTEFMDACKKGLVQSASSDDIMKPSSSSRLRKH
jgi:hypothetical protein